MGGPFGLDMGAVMMMAGAAGVDGELLVDILPAIEKVIVTRFDNE
jgi:hypothetical protein